MTKVIIIRAPSGAGKDTYLDALAAVDDLTAAVHSADAFFTKDGGDYAENFHWSKLADAHKYCFGGFVGSCDAAEVAAAGGKAVADPDVIIVNNTNTCLFEMAPYIMYAQLRGVEIEIHEVSVPGATAADYCAWNTHGVPLQGIEGQISRWEESLPFWPPVTKVHALRDSREFGVCVLDDEGEPTGEYLRKLPLA